MFPGQRVVLTHVENAMSQDVLVARSLWEGAWTPAPASPTPCPIPRPIAPCEARYLVERGWTHRTATGTWDHPHVGFPRKPGEPVRLMHGMSGAAALRAQAQLEAAAAARARVRAPTLPLVALVALAAAGDALAPRPPPRLERTP